MPLRELTRDEISVLRPYAGSPMSGARMDAMLAAYASGFVKTDDKGFFADVGFQCACIAAMQRGKLSGHDMPYLLSSVDPDRFGHYVLRIVKNSDTQAIIFHIADTARMLIRSGYTIDVNLLYSDLYHWFDEDREPVKRWMQLLYSSYKNILDDRV